MRGLTGERDDGNGSLMRTVPLSFTDATDDEVSAVSAITHVSDLGGGARRTGPPGLRGHGRHGG